MAARPLISVVDDDESVRESLPDMLNKQIALKLGISEITVKAHRGKMMQKMKAESLADLVKMAVRPGLALREIHGTRRLPTRRTSRCPDPNTTTILIAMEYGVYLAGFIVVGALSSAGASILLALVRDLSNAETNKEGSVKILMRSMPISVGILVLVLAHTSTAQAQTRRGIEDRFASVNGLRLHYLVAGKGEPVILLHGYAENSHMWRPLMFELAKSHTVVAPDLRGFGQSSKPPTGYDKKRMAQDVHALAVSLGYRRSSVVGHDIGLMVAYAYAAQYPTEVDRIVLMDAFLPGVGDWKTVWLLRDLWHFHFYGETPLKLVAGRERIYFEHFWNDFAADPKHSVPEAARQFYARSYAQPGAMRAGFEVFHNFEQDAKDFAQFAKTKLTMPMLVLTGEKASGEFLIEQARLVDTNVEGVVIRGKGHWLMEEATPQVIPRLVGFINKPQ